MIVDNILQYILRQVDDLPLFYCPILWVLPTYMWFVPMGRALIFY